MNWDLTSFFPEFNGSEMKNFKADLQNDISDLLEKSSKMEILSKQNAPQWEEVILKAEDLIARHTHIESYVGCLSSCDANNEEYSREEASLALVGAHFQKVEIEILRAIKNAPEDVFKSFIKRPAFDGIEFYLERMLWSARRTMSAEKERLSADLGVDGIGAWGRLYDNLSGKLTFEMVYPDGRRETLPISQRRALMDDPDRSIRKAAFDGGNEAWQSMEHVCAAALNAISGTRLTLYKHRSIEHFLDMALFQSAISNDTLKSMFGAIKDNIEIPRRYLRLKAKMMSTDGVAWYDLGSEMPMPNMEKMPWPKGRQVVCRAFDNAYSSLGAFAREAYDRNWVEWEKRAGKRPGAFCTGSLLSKESRIFMTFNGTMGDVRTLAHETGHAFHSRVMREVRPLAHMYPMTLAETASTFAEMILTDNLLNDPELDNKAKCFILDQSLGNAAVYLMDIPVRFDFEKNFYEERSKGEIPVSRLKEMITDTQRDIFGDVLLKGGEDPLFWASKLHFYITGVSFYNFPYAFGFLLSQGLYAMFKKEGEDFLPKYEKLLKLSGSGTCEDVVKEGIGEDLKQPEFWARAVKSQLPLIEQLEHMLKIN